jgi:2-polyprenyl-3-methyl-5-hydroxy-6-metoxy-1,4-benzoquinol methylase
MTFSLIEAVERDAPVQVEWEETACLLCRGRNWFTLVEAPDRTPDSAGLWFAVVQCNDCGLCFTNPRPTVESMAQFYPHDYAPHQLTARPAKKVRSPRGRWKGYELYVAPSGGRRLLDFGCGGGSFLAGMHADGWDVTGVDTSLSVVNAVQTQLGLRAIRGTLPHAQLEGERFDLITMRQSLEHVHQPAEVLAAAHRLLVPRGRLVVAVPNIDSLPFRWFGHAWYGLDLPRHLTHFAPWTLKLMLERAGFRPGKVRHIRRGKWLHASAGQAHREAPASRFYSFLARRPAASLLSWYSYWTRQCDCIVLTAARG